MPLPLTLPFTLGSVPVGFAFGGHTVGFVTVTAVGERGYLGVKNKQRVSVDVAGCRMRAVRVTETPDAQEDVADAVWKCTAPPAAGVLAAKSTGELMFAGDTFQIVGPVLPKHNMDGSLHHVTIMCKRQAG